MEVGDETAFVEFSDEPEAEPEHAAVYYFACCKVAIAEVRWKDGGGEV